MSVANILFSIENEPSVISRTVKRKLTKSANDSLIGVLQRGGNWQWWIAGTLVVEPTDKGTGLGAETQDGAALRQKCRFIANVLPLLEDRLPFSEDVLRSAGGPSSRLQRD